MLPLVSVVVVNWNRRELLRCCLRSLARQSYQDFEVLVVDNGSTDGSSALAEQAEFQGRHHWIRNAENHGFCAANNQAIRRARGTYIALLNNDAEADPGWLAALVGALAGALERNPRIGMAASKVLSFSNRGVIDKVGHVIYPDGQNCGRGSGEQDRGQYDQPEEVAWPDGCAALYRKQLLDEIGGFDEDFFAYGDDAELGLRARIAGWRCLYVPQARVYHRLGATLGRHSERRAFLIERNRIWLAVKLFPCALALAQPFLLRSAGSGDGGRGRAGPGRRRTLDGLVGPLSTAKMPGQGPYCGLERRAGYAPQAASGPLATAALSPGNYPAHSRLPRLPAGSRVQRLLTLLANRVPRQLQRRPRAADLPSLRGRVVPDAVSRHRPSLRRDGYSLQHCRVLALRADPPRAAALAR